MSHQTCKMSVGVIAVVALVLGASGVAQANTIVTLYATADVRLINATGLTNTNYNDAYLSPYNQPGNVENSLLKFDLSGILAGSTINSATLTIFNVNGNSNSLGSRIEVYRLTQAWVESQAT